MSLAPGTRLGPYEVLEPLGAGGMGEVVRARDSRLERLVAIKSLPPAFAADPERMARFEREAKLLASLDHPHIAGIYGLEDVGGATHLVLEFVDGESLAARLSRGPLDVRETLEIGAQIASAIEAAHERGIVHRDLKPGNVMLTPSRGVKVLDFGLAKGAAIDGGMSGDLSASPTVALSATGAGVILGTASYMSPEQARGRGVDRRTDVWAFGCVLFECLTGRQAFAGETVSDVIARILEREPEWSALPAPVPPRLRDLVRRCLTKDAAERPRDIGDLRRELSAMALERSSPAAAAPEATPSLAVLYFENLASDTESQYFCSGITEDILTDLSKIKGLRVASRNAVARYRGAPADIPRVASDLNVTAVLEGSVRRSGDRVRITAQLINAADGFHLWAERYDRTLQDVFAVQEEIASSIAEALRVALSPAESKQLVRNRPNDVRAYDLYLKGRELYGRYRGTSMSGAMDLFQQAVAVDPDYALAWAGIADCYGQMLQWETAPDESEARRLGIEAARRAIALDPRLPEAHKAHSLVLRYCGDREGERAALARALEVNPRFVPALINLAVEHYSDANLAGAERLIRRALEIDPQEAFATIWMSNLLLQTGRFDEGIATAQRLRALSQEPFYVTARHQIIGGALAGRGDWAEAMRTVREGIAEGADAASIRTIEAAGMAREGRIEDARRLLRELEAASVFGEAIYMLSWTALSVGEPEVAVRLLSRSLTRDLAPTGARLHPDLHPLLDRDPFAPRRRDATLVWPLEAPMIDAARFALFRDVKIASGLPQGSDVLRG